MLILFALQQVLLPAHVVDIDDVAVAIDVEDLIDDSFNQIHIVGDDDEPTRIVNEVVTEPDDGICIKVVSWLIQ